MVLLVTIVLSWLVLSTLTLGVAVGFCRSGHAEDVARGWSDDVVALPVPVVVTRQ